MHVLTFKEDAAVLPGGTARCALLTVEFTNRTTDSVILNEDQAQRAAMTVTMASRPGELASLNSLEHRGGPARAKEFLARRTLLSALTDDGLGRVASDVRPIIHGGGLLLPAAKALGTLFLAFFDPFSAHGLVTAVDDCFG